MSAGSVTRLSAWQCDTCGQWASLDDMNNSCERYPACQGYYIGPSRTGGIPGTFGPIPPRIEAEEVVLW